jgi:DNA-binding response OmpR family regulator
VAGKNVLVLEDEAGISDVLESFLRRDGFQPTMCATVEAARAALAESRPAIMILDVGLPDGSGLDVLREASAGKDPVPVIMLTARGDESDRIVGLELGADDYITKPFSPRELMARVRALLRRVERSPATSSSQSTRVGALEIDPASHEARINGKAANLTVTEFRILSVLATHPGHVFTRAVLLDRLNDTGKIFERTLDRHINNLRKKLEQDSRNPVYIVTVYGVGYKLCGP